jgi:hypothetical protein
VGLVHSRYFLACLGPEQAAEKSILGEIGSMRLAENKEDGEVNSSLQRPLQMFFSNLLERDLPPRNI